MKKICVKYTDFFGSLKDFPLLFMRLILAYGFYEPAIMKFRNMDAIIQWFGEMGIIAPKITAYLAAITELSGVVLLLSGFAVRFISFPLIITMIVAIKTVHWSAGFQASNNGFEIPLYYVIMLFALMVFGPGRISLDYLCTRFCKGICCKKKEG